MFITPYKLVLSFVHAGSMLETQSPKGWAVFRVCDLDRKDVKHVAIPEFLIANEAALIDFFGNEYKLPIVERLTEQEKVETWGKTGIIG